MYNPPKCSGIPEALIDCLSGLGSLILGYLDDGKFTILAYSHECIDRRFHPYGVRHFSEFSILFLKSYLTLGHPIQRTF